MRTLPESIAGERAYQKLRTWVADAQSDLNFCLVMQSAGGRLTHVPRTKQPCYGEMRVDYSDIEKPNDLHNPFPKTGTPVAVGWGFPSAYSASSSQAQLVDYLCSNKYGPYRNLIESGDLTPVINDTGDIKGMLLTNTKMNVDCIVHLMIFLRRILSSEQHAPFYNMYKQGVDPRVAFILAQELGEWGYYRAHSKSSKYDWPYDFDYRAWYNGDPNEHTETVDGKLVGMRDYTLFDRCKYHRDDAGNHANVWGIRREKQHDERLCVHDYFQYDEMKKHANKDGVLDIKWVYEVLVPLVTDICVRGDKE